MSGDQENLCARVNAVFMIEKNRFNLQTIDDFSFAGLFS